MGDVLMRADSERSNENQVDGEIALLMGWLCKLPEA
jgi:hypothetical protein